MTIRSAAKGRLGAHLAAGMLAFASMTVILAMISEEVIGREPVMVADARFIAWLHVHASWWLTVAMRVATSLGATPVVTGISLVLALYLWWRRRWYWLAALALSVPGGALLNVLLKMAFHRPRPHFDDPILTVTGYSFPSGHTMMASVLYGVIAAYACAHTPDWRRRVLAVGSAGVLILLVAFSRVYLGAHYVSDVLGAMAEGTAWLSLCLTALYTIRHRRVTGPAGDAPMAAPPGHPGATRAP